MQKDAFLGGKCFRAVEQVEHDQGQDTGAYRSSVGQSLESHASGVIWGRSSGRHHSFPMVLKVLYVLAKKVCLFLTQTSGRLSVSKCANLRVEIRSFPKEPTCFCLL